MKDTIKHLLEVMDRINKRNQIKNSGSIKGNVNEKIRSGQSYLYKKDGMESEVFEIRFTQAIAGGALNHALTQTMQRFPYCNAKVLELDGDFFIVRNENSAFAKKTRILPQLGSISNTYHLVDVTYFNCSVYVSFHHALCDGRGIKPFIETLLYYYCKTRYNSNASAEGIRLAEAPLLEGESTEPFSKRYEYDESKLFVEIPREGYPIPENVAQEAKRSYRYELTMPQEQFMAACRTNSATPAILVTLLMNQAIAKLYPDYDKDIHANIATDMRQALGVPNTFKNCVKTMTLPYSRTFAALPMPEKATCYRELLNQQRDYDYCRKEANAMLGLYDKLDKQPNFEEKQKIMHFFENMILNTYVISYIGSFTLNENAQHIDTIHLYNSGVVGLGINMICCSGKFILDFKQSFFSDKYVKEFVGQLPALGIPHTLTGAIEFETPTDALLKRN